MRVVVMAILGALGALPGSAAFAQEANLEEVCAFCRAVGAQEESVRPASGGAPAYQRNLGQISNCLDRALLGADRLFTASGYGQEEIRQSIVSHRWQETRADGATCSAGEGVPSCLNNSEKIQALYLVMFGPVGFNAIDVLGAPEQAQLTCQAAWVDLSAALSRVTQAAQ